MAGCVASRALVGQLGLSAERVRRQARPGRNLGLGCRFGPSRASHSPPVNLVRQCRSNGSDSLERAINGGELGTLRKPSSYFCSFFFFSRHKKIRPTEWPSAPSLCRLLAMEMRTARCMHAFLYRLVNGDAHCALHTCMLLLFLCMRAACYFSLSFFLISLTPLFYSPSMFLFWPATFFLIATQEN
jgi:hypothetical protein